VLWLAGAAGVVAVIFDTPHSVRNALIACGAFWLLTFLLLWGLIRG
jgi:hypothetical protein